MKTIPGNIDKYLIIKELGHGNFGHVYLAHDRALDAEKALKVLNVDKPHEFLLLLEEAKLLHKCRHKYIVQVNEANVYQVENVPKVIIDMEYIPKGSLEKHLEENFLSTIDASNYVRDILFGLEHLHNQNVLHRDIKPGNIMLADGYAKLSDFGLATSGSDTLVGSPRGYFSHLAPELFSGQKILGKTTVLTDIYATGITFFRLVSNIVNWEETVQKLNDIQIISSGQLIDEIGFPPYVSKKIQRIIKKACNPDPKRRYQSAREMRQALEKLHTNINWKPSNELSWQGSNHNGDSFLIMALESKEVIFKKNNRKIGILCKKFSEKQKAADYLMEYIEKSTYH